MRTEANIISDEAQTRAKTSHFHAVRTHCQGFTPTRSVMVRSAQCHEVKNKSMAKVGATAEVFGLETYDTDRELSL